MYMQKLKIRSFEKGLLFQDGEYKKILDQGQHWFFDPLGKTRVGVVSMRKPWLTHDDLDLIVSSGQPGDEALVYELTDTQRGLVWVDNLFQTIIGPGLHVLWQGFRKIRVELLEKVAESSNLNIVCGDRSLSGNLMKIL